MKTNKRMSLIKLTQETGASFLDVLIIFVLFKIYYHRVKNNKFFSVIKKLNKKPFLFCVNKNNLSSNFKVLKAIDYANGNVMCKETSIVAYLLLQHSNYNPEYNLGIKKERNQILGHAWVTTKEGVCFDTCNNAENFNVIWKWNNN